MRSQSLGLFICGCWLVGVADGYLGKEAVTGDYSRLYSPANEHIYDHRVVSILQTNVIHFQIKACSDAHILMAHSMDDTFANASEIVIGGWDNTKSIIRVAMYGEHLVTVPTPNILNCAEYRSFWIHVAGSYIEVGYGPVSHEQPFMRTERRGHSVHDVGFSTGYGHAGVWQIMANMGHRMRVWTPDTTPPDFQFLSKTVRHRSSFFSFEIAACQDAHIVMGPTEVDIPEKWPYKIILGAYENQQVCLSYYGVIQNCSTLGNILDCDAPRLFWISWYGGLLRVGRGIVYGKNQLAEWKDASFVGISVLSFATGWGFDGFWKFNEELENKYTFGHVSTHAPTFFLRWSYVPRTSHVYFSIMSCEEVHVALAAGQPRNADTDFLYFFFGGSGNMKSGVKRGVDGVPTTIVHEVDTPNILQCNMLPMWVHWSTSRRYISAGLGNVYGLNELLRYEVPENGQDFIVYFVGYSNPAQDSAWLVPIWSGDEMLLETPGNYQMDDTWLSVYGEEGKIFKVAACMEVHIILSELVGVTSEKAHEVIIGYNGNQQTVIKDYVSGHIHANEETPGILSCKEQKHFWVSWDRNYIRVGTGDRIGRETVASMDMVLNHHIYAMSMSSTNLTAKFTIENDVGDVYVVQTPNAFVNYKWSSLTSSLHWIYFQLRARTGRLVVSPKYRDEGSGYHLYIGDKENTQTSLYKGNTLLKNAITPDILDPNDLRSFWIGCTDGMLQFGKGKTHKAAVQLEYKAGKSCDFNAIGYSGAEDSIAFWKFYEAQGMGELSYDTSTAHDFDQQWIGVIHRTHIAFGVQACHSVGIMLSTFLGSHNWHNTYVIELQNQMGMSVIWGPYYSNHGYREKFTEAYTPDKLSCTEERMFWLSWFGGHIALGSGTKLGENVIVTYHDYDPVPVRGLGISTNGTWGIFRYTYSASGFMENPAGSGGGLSGGEITAAVFGFLALFALFGALLYVIMKPPEPLKPYILPAGAPAPNPQNPLAASQPSTGGFDNPMSMEASRSQRPAHAEPQRQDDEDIEPQAAAPASGPAMVSDPFFNVATIDKSAAPGYVEPDDVQEFGSGGGGPSLRDAVVDVMGLNNSTPATEDQLDIFG